MKKQPKTKNEKNIGGKRIKKDVDTNFDFDKTLKQFAPKPKKKKR